MQPMYTEFQFPPLNMIYLLSLGHNEPCLLKMIFQGLQSCNLKVLLYIKQQLLNAYYNNRTDLSDTI